MKLQNLLFTFLSISSVTYPMGGYLAGGLAGKDTVEVINKVADVLDRGVFGPDSKETIKKIPDVMDKSVKTVSQTIDKGIFGPGGVQVIHDATQVASNGIQAVNKTVDNATRVIHEGIGEVHKAIKVIDRNTQNLNDEINKTNAEIANANKTFATLIATLNNFDPPDRLAKTFGLGVIGFGKICMGIYFLKVGIQKVLEDKPKEHEEDTPNKERTSTLTPEQTKALIMCICGFSFMSVGGYVMLHPGTIVNYFAH